MTNARRSLSVPRVASSKRSNGSAPLVMVTAYDHHSARLVDAAGVDLILVGDSLGMVIQGRPDTLAVTVDDICYHSRCVASAEPAALVVADMPWLSYHVSPADSVRNAGRLIQEGRAEAVKLEGGSARHGAIRALLDAEIPVMGHLGLTPQSVHAMGGFRVQGREQEDAERLLDEARGLEEVGVFAMVLEGIPADLAARITDEIGVPTIGIGAGPDCDGQVLVFHDVLGITATPLPKFVRTYSDLAGSAVEALREFSADVREGRFPAEAESYGNTRRTERAEAAPNHG